MSNHDSRLSTSGGTNLTTTSFRVVANRRITFLRTDIVMLIEQSLTTLMDGAVIDAFRFEIRYSEMREFRARLCQYIRKLYRNDAVPSLPEIAPSSPPQVFEETLRAVEAILEFVYQRKYLVESPLFKSFMHHKQTQKVERSGSTSVVSSENSESPSFISSADSGVAQQVTPVLQPTKLTITANVLPQDYLIEAGALLIGARRNESEQRYSEAYELYKLAIQTLLEGARLDPDSANVAVVKRKIAVLLDTADRIYETHLAKNSDSTANPPDEAGFAMAELKQLFQNYKIIEIEGKVVILQEKLSNKIQAVKILRKSSKFGKEPPTIVPTDIERMVRLTSLHETETSILLMLEYIPGGPLFNHFGLVDSYPSSVAKNPTPLDPSASILKPRQQLSHQDSTDELLFRRWSLNLSSSDWHSAVHQPHRHRLPSEVKKRPEVRAMSDSLIEDDDSAIVSRGTTDDFQHVLTTATSTAQPTHFSIDATLSGQSVNSDQASAADVSTCTFVTADQSVLSEKEQSPTSKVQEENVMVTPEPAKPTQKSLPPIGNVQRWALQILDSLDSLHRYGLVWGDMNPNNVLYDATDDGIRLTFVCSWSSVEPKPPNDDAARNGYVAPELLGPFTTVDRTIAADYWSLGAVIFNLLVGCAIGSYIGDMQSVSVSHFLDAEIADIVKQRVKNNDAAVSLLLLLLRKNPSDRLCAADKIRTHSFFVPKSV